MAGRCGILLEQDKPQERTAAPQRPVTPPAQPRKEGPERPNDRTIERAFGKRIITRNSFEVYEDQMESLRERSYQEKRAGKLGSMSAMVRDAIDAYLKKTS